MPSNFPKSTRFAGLSPQISCGIILLVIVAIAYGIHVYEAIAIKGSDKGLDLECQRAIVERMHAGEKYYEAAHKELRRRGYPTQSIFNWRLPFLAWFLAVLPSIEMGRWLGIGLAAATLLLWVTELKKEKSFSQTLIGSLLLTGVLVYGGIPDLFFAHEFWAGTCITLSLIAYSRGWLILSLGTGFCALLFRELSLPFVCVMALVALIEKRQREFWLWLLGTIAFLIILGIHGSFVRGFITDADFAQKGGWIAFGGWQFVLKTIQLHPFLILNGPWLNAILIPLLLLGLAGWKGELGTRVSLSVGTYILAFLVLGQPFNVYWGAMFNSLIPFGALYTLPSVLDLCRSISKRPVQENYLG